MAKLHDSGQIPGTKFHNSAAYLTCHRTSLGRSSNKKRFGIIGLRKQSKASGNGNRVTN